MVSNLYVNYKILRMTGFELGTSGIGSNCSANWATSTALWDNLFDNAVCCRDIIKFKKAQALEQDTKKYNLQGWQHITA